MNGQHKPWMNCCVFSAHTVVFPMPPNERVEDCTTCRTETCKNMWFARRGENNSRLLSSPTSDFSSTRIPLDVQTPGISLNLQKYIYLTMIRWQYHLLFSCSACTL